MSGTWSAKPCLIANNSRGFNYERKEYFQIKAIISYLEETVERQQRSLKMSRKRSSPLLLASK